MILNHLLKHMANPWVAREERFKKSLKSSVGDKETVCCFGFEPRSGHPGGS